MGEIETELRHYLEGGTEPAQMFEWSRDTQAAMVDLKFCDLLGTWQHMTLPLGAFDESAFEEGLGFDGSSIRGWQGIHESDMLLMPDPTTAILDPFTEAPTLSLLCEIVDPVTASRTTRIRAGSRSAPRSTCARPASPTRAYFGPECEFFVFDEVRYELARTAARYEVDSAEGHWNSGTPGPRLHDPREGGLLPAGAARHAERPAHARWC